MRAHKGSKFAAFMKKCQVKLPQPFLITPENIHEAFPGAKLYIDRDMKDCKPRPYDNITPEIFEDATLPIENVVIEFRFRLDSGRWFLWLCVRSDHQLHRINLLPLSIIYDAVVPVSESSTLIFRPVIAWTDGPILDELNGGATANFAIEKYSSFKPIEVSLPDTVVSLPVPPWSQFDQVESKQCFKSEYRAIINRWLASLKPPATTRLGTNLPIPPWLESETDRRKPRCLTSEYKKTISDWVDSLDLS